MDPETIYLSTIDPKNVSESAIACASYLCPCRCGHEVYLPLSPKAPSKTRFTWGFEIGAEGTRAAGLITFTPSISAKKENGLCGAHYFIRNGLVEWC